MLKTDDTNACLVDQVLAICDMNCLFILLLLDQNAFVFRIRKLTTGQIQGLKLAVKISG